MLFGQEDPPTPRDRTIITHKSPASPMYVRSFGGFATQQGVLGEAAKLKEAVQEDGHSVLTEWFYFASYDPPYRCVHFAAPSLTLLASAVRLRSMHRCMTDTIVSCDRRSSRH